MTTKPIMKRQHEMSRMFRQDGQAVLEYIVLFAVSLGALWVGAQFFGNVQDRMNETRDNGIQLIMGR